MIGANYLADSPLINFVFRFGNSKWIRQELWKFLSLSLKVRRRDDRKACTAPVAARKPCLGFAFQSDSADKP